MAETPEGVDRYEATFFSYKHIWLDKDGWHMEEIKPQQRDSHGGDNNKGDSQ